VFKNEPTPVQTKLSAIRLSEKKTLLDQSKIDLEGCF
jgi:hypothetical protein